MIYILDTNFFIEANKWHLPLDREHIFWNWLVSLAKSGTISIPKQVFDELIAGNDNLATWVTTHKGILVNQAAAFTQIRRVMAEGYGPMTDTEIQGLRADPWIIAHALAVNGTVITSEKPGNHTAPRNKKIPSVCKVLHIPCFTITGFLWQMRSSLPVIPG